MNNQSKIISTDEVIDFLHTSGIFQTSDCEDNCKKCQCPLYVACPNCLMQKLVELEARTKTQVINDEIAWLEECRMNDSEIGLISWRNQQRLFKLKQQVEKIE